jgi:DNA-binding LacI/PurR family transcriptional regulator
VFAQSRDAIEGLALLAPGISSAADLAQRALAQPGVTCCIAGSDLEAMVLLDECTQRGISVPGRLSVCAFDDTAAASVWSLTSYNFNDEAVMAAMVDHVLGGRRYQSAATGRDITIDGHVRERRSTAPLRAA